MTIDEGYEAGYLTSIVSPPDVSWLQDIRYHANGLWSEVDHRNNWTERQTIAAHGMQRPVELSAENAAGQQQYTTGPFALTWTPLGDPDVMSYPTCSGVACQKGEPGMTIDHGYEAGCC